MKSTKITNTVLLERPEQRLADSFKYTQTVNKPFGGVDSVIAWCKTECLGDWRWQIFEMSNDQQPGTYIFYFDNEKDCCAFALKWC